MNFDELIESRRSIRVFEPRAVEAEKLQAILEAANRAPSAGDLQAFEIVRVTDAAARSRLAQAALGQSFIAAAPVVLLFFANPARSSSTYGRRGIELYCVQDATIACTFAHLRATDLGLGSVWVGAFLDDAVSAAVAAPKELRPVAILPIGYAAESPAPTPRRGVRDLVRSETF